MDLSNKRLLIRDGGLSVPFAQKMCEFFGEVYYFTPNEIEFPKEQLSEIGYGTAKNLIRIKDNFFDYINKADAFAFPDVGAPDLQKHLKDLGKPVMGSFGGEKLEQDRWFYRELQDELEMDHPATCRVTGLMELQKELMGTKDRYVKYSKYRGNMETFHHIDYETSIPFFNKFAFELGPMAEYSDFIVDDAINGDEDDPIVETGYDGFTVNGEFPDIADWGFEIKDKFYIARIDEYKNFPEAILKTNEQLASTLRKYGVQNLFSSELRVSKSGNAFLCDPCMRGGNPPLDVMLEAYSNWGDIVWDLAHGKMPDPKPTGKYMAMAIIHSTHSDRGWQNMRFPEKDSRWYKFKNLIKIDGEYWIVPIEQGLYEVGSVCAVEDTPDAAIKKVEERAKEIDAYDIEVRIDAVQEALDTVKKAELVGINF